MLQFFVILAGLIPLVVVGLHDMGGWGGLTDKVAANKNGGDGFLHTWQGTGVGDVTNPIGSSWIGIVFGLGFLLSFGYWTTNFAEVQRAMSARNMSAARRTPLIGAFPKLFIPALTIIPGLIALVLFPKLGADSGEFTYTNAIPLLIDKYLPNGVLGIAVTGLLAAFMAGMAANVSSFNTVVTYDIWQTYIKKDRDDAYYLRTGRVVHRRRHPDRHRHRVHRGGLQQHHELRPGAVLVLQRPAVRDVHHRHLLEADDGLGRLLGPAGRHPRRAGDLPPVQGRCRDRSAPTWRRPSGAPASRSWSPACWRWG